MIKDDWLSSDNSLYLAMLPKPPPDTNYCANVLDDSALKTSLEIKVTAIEMLSLVIYFKELSVKYMISALASSAEIYSTSLS